MKTTSFAKLIEQDQSLLREATERLPRSLNKVSNPQTSAIVLTENNRHYGNNIFLSNCTLFCAEASAFAASVAANDSKILKLYLVSGRQDTKIPKLISPCGNCRQVFHDISHLNGNTIQVFLATNQLDEVMVTDSAELLPSGFMSASLGKMADI